MNMSLIGTNIQIVVSDPWDFVTKHGSFLQGRIVGIEENTSQKLEIEIILHPSLLHEKVKISSLFAHPRHMCVTQQSTLSGSNVAFNFSNVKREEAEKNNFQILKLIGSIDFPQQTS